VSKIRFCVSKKQNFCLSDSEFNFAETKIVNFWQREHPVGDFSLILDFAHARQNKQVWFCTRLIAKLVRFFWSSKEMNEKKHTTAHCQP
jgi:hypothetical protein